MIKEIVSNRKIIGILSKNDFKNKFAGSYLGIFWAFVQPIVVVCIYWFVFGKGLKPSSVISTTEVPFLLKLVAGICPWFFFNEAVNSVCNCFVEYSYIVKKVVFKIEILPIVKILSAFFVHIFFILLVMIVFAINGWMPNIYYVQALYYTFCVFALSLSLAYFLSAITVFFKDMSQIVNIILQFGMWFTPIMYDLEDIFPNQIVFLLKFNPMYYCVVGYRDSFIYKKLFFERPVMTLYFWGFVFCSFLIGKYVFSKLKPHFADVL